jgi:FtsH-binding integral membrane protein
MDEQYGTTQIQGADVQLARQSFLTSVFGWMFLGLALTAGIAAYVAASSDMISWFEDHTWAWLVMFIAQLGLVVTISAGINKLSYSVSVFLFALYAALNGFIFSVILEAYTTASIASAFGVAAGMFGGMAIYGYVTKRDLTGMRSILFMGLIGLIIGMVVNMFWANSVLYWFVTFGGVVLFCALTAYDMQKIKQIGESGADAETLKKASILGALSHYLDFINLFRFLLRIFGSAR